jgi:hypothetical protein
VISNKYYQKTSGIKGEHTRRNVLKAVGSVGASSIALTYGPQSVRAGDDIVKIITHMSGDKIAQTQKVNKQWYDQKERAKKVHERIQRNYGSDSRVLSINIHRLEERIGGLRKFGVRVSFDKEKNTIPLPNEIDGVPITTTQISGFESMCYTGYQDPINGGNGHTSPSAAATLTCRVYKGGNKYMMGCRHVFVDDNRDDDNCNGTDITGKKWSQGGDEVGKVDYAYQNHDCTLLDKSTDGTRVFDNGIVDETGYVAGRVTANGVDHLIANDTTVRKRGRSSCREKGEVIELGTIWCNNGNYVGNAVRSSARIESGDSGGVQYHKIPKSSSSDELYVINITTHSLDDTNDDTWGSAAYAMHNKRDISFGGESFSG